MSRDFQESTCTLQNFSVFLYFENRSIETIVSRCSMTELSRSVTSKIYRKCRFLSFLNRKLNASKRKLKYQLVGLAWEINAPVENVYTSWRRKLSSSLGSEMRDYCFINSFDSIYCTSFENFGSEIWEYCFISSMNRMLILWNVASILSM